MFRELRYRAGTSTSSNKVPLMPMNTLWGSLSSWLVSDKTLDNNPAVVNLRQLRETCSLQTMRNPHGATQLSTYTRCLHRTDNHHHPRCTESIIH